MVKNKSRNKRVARSNRNTLKKKGGAAAQETQGPVKVTDQLFHELGIYPYYSHAKILRDFFIKNKVGACKQIPQKDLTIYFINRGFNGFILQFRCGDTVNAIKILFKTDYIDPEKPEWLEHITEKIRKEYTNIRIFNECPYIVKGQGYFTFDGKNKFTCNGLQPYDTNLTIAGGIEGDLYKSLKKDNSAWVEPFGGIIIEYIDHALSDIGSHLSELNKDGSEKILIEVRVLIFLELFYQYVSAISFINRKKYVHTDIKIENLMYKKDDEEFDAKIVDLANIKNYEQEYDLRSNSRMGSKLKQYHTGAILFFESVQRELGVAPSAPSGSAKPVPTKESIEIKKKKIKDIAERYDLYCLCITFWYLFSEIKDKVFNIDEAVRTHARSVPGKGAAERKHAKRTIRLANAKAALVFLEKKLRAIYSEVDINKVQTLLSLQTNEQMGRELYPHLQSLNPSREIPRFWEN